MIPKANKCFKLIDGAARDCSCKKAAAKRNTSSLKEIWPVSKTERRMILM